VRLPSVRHAISEARKVLVRFPLVMLSAAVAATAGCLLAGSDWRDPILTSVLATSTLGLPLFFAIAVTLERMASRRLALPIYLAGLAGLVGFGVAWHGWTDAIQLRRYLQVNIGLHLLVAFLPYARGGENNGFWQYNRTLFLRFLIAGLYAAVLFVGLSAALLAIDKLLKIAVPGNTYMRLWFVMAFVFDAWFFLGGAPDDLAALDSRRDYPQALKVFSQFILTPLVAIYLLILTAYLGRILITGQWPSGSIGYLVSTVAAVGMLSLLLVHPIRDREENRWVATYARGFYIALLPSIGMLLAAIWKRVGQYGLTEDRYFIAVLALWLTLIAVTFIARRGTDIRIIPVTLCLLAFATAFGPGSAYAVSHRSQLDRLRALLTRNGLLANGEVRPATAPLPAGARRDMSATLLYLFGTYGKDGAKPVLGKTAGMSKAQAAEVAANARPDGLLLARATMRSLGTEFMNAWDESRPDYFSFGAATYARNEVEDVREVDYHVWVSGELPARFRVDGVTWQLRPDGRARVLRLLREGRAVLSFPLDTLVAIAHRGVTVADSIPLPRIEAASPEIDAKLILHSFGGFAQAESVALGTLDGDLYLTLSASRPPSVK
jgi:hypothetical protein